MTDPSTLFVDANSWTLRKKIGQLIVVRASGFLFDHQIRYPAWEPLNTKLKQWLETLNLGGVILLGGSAAELAARTAQLQSWSPTPLLIAADIEEGVGQRFVGATWFPPPMALGAVAEQDLALAQDYARQMGAATAQEALALGLNWILAPIADVNNNEDNPVINIRAFGEDPTVVSALIKAFIEGAQDFPLLTTAKHFPGHGDTDSDSHLHLPVIPHDLERLKQVELPPFQGAIAQGVDSVMTAHILVPAWDGDNPATLSPTILTGQLREALQFDGIIVTDALIMGGVTQIASPEEVAIRAISAGADILLMPPDPVPVILAIEQAVQTGRLSEERIDQSLQRVLKAKQKLDFSPNSLPISQTLNPEPARQVVHHILTTALQKGGTLPIARRNPATGHNLIVVDDFLTADFLDRVCPALTLPKQAGYEPQLLTPELLQHYPQPQRPFILQVFIRGNPFRGTAGLSETSKALYRQYLGLSNLQGLILYGSPYVLDWFHQPMTEVCPDLPWVFSHGQMPQAQAIAAETLLGLTPAIDPDKVFI
ncbi:MAG: Beta-hexosaminidase [Cyanobacteriota bacterium]